MSFALFGTGLREVSDVSVDQHGAINYYIIQS